MNLVDNLMYPKIVSIIEIIQTNSKQLNLAEISEKVNLSSTEIQQLFKDWAGVEIEQFWQNIRIPKQDKTINNQQTSLFDTSDQLKKRANARVHHSLVEIVEIAAEEFKNGKGFSIEYSFNDTIFGEVLIASTSIGISYLGFSDNRLEALSELDKRFPKADCTSQTNQIQQNALLAFDSDWSKIKKIKLHLQGTEFQIQVWKKLLQIPTGDLTTYGSLATQIQKPKAARAVGTAIGSNPIAFLIPCHRVIQSSGTLGGYMWGNIRKTALIGWEASLK